MSDRHAVVCNYTESTKIASEGAKAYVSLMNKGNDHDRIMVLVRSHGGRLVQKWENVRRLDGFRLKTLPPEHPRYSDERIWPADERDVETLRASKVRNAPARDAGSEQ